MLIRNIRIVKHIIKSGGLISKGINIQPHITKLSSVLPIHRSALEALKDPSIMSFLADKSVRSLGKIRDWQNVPLSWAEPFLKLNLESKAINVREDGKVVTINVLIPKDVPLTEDKVPLVFDGNEYSFPLAKPDEAVKEQTGIIISPPITPPGPEFELKGRPASYYIGIGRAHVPTRPDISKFPSADIKAEEIEREVKDASDAFKAVRETFNNNSHHIENGDKNDPRVVKKKAMATTTLNMLDNLSDLTIEKIEKENMNFKKALEKTLTPVIDNILATGDEKLCESVEGLKGIFASLILARHSMLPDLLAGVESVSKFHNGEKVVVVCTSVDFVEAASLDPDKITAVVEERGGIKSHSTISCESSGIPLVIGVENATKKINNGDIVIVDGERGRVIINPNKLTIEKFLAIKKESEKEKAFLRGKYKGKTAKTMDGIEVVIMGNSKSIAETERLKYEGAKNIGLFRTEEFMDVGLLDGRTIVRRTREPSLNEQVKFYFHVYETINGKDTHVVIRTMDVNGDKYITYLGEPKKNELGQTSEGIGLCLDQQNHKPYYDLFKDQIKAILIAAKQKDVEPIIEFPMVMSVKQFEEAKAVVEKAMNEMREDKVDFESKIKYYAMVEHPNLISEIDELAKAADGLSIGTNDLTMKTLFQSRYSAKTRFNELDPEVLSSIEKTIKAAKNANKPLLVCGDMASDPISVPVLLGLGIRELSVDASAVNVIKSMVSNIDIKACERLVNDLRQVKTAEKARSDVAHFIMTRMEHGDAEQGDWKGLKELDPVLKKYIYFMDEK